MKIKVCGMKHPSNIREIADLGPNYMGFIFYDKSKRYVGDLDEKLLLSLLDVQKVGVFVNASLDYILTQAIKFGFSYIQLHGDETPADCQKLKQSGLGIIKAFFMEENFDFEKLNGYKPYCDYFLFDTKGENYGGTGKKFNWDILKKYDNKIPFFLSGGIDLDQAEEIKNLKGLNIHAIDINSRFEIQPGLKDVKKVKKFMEQF